MKQVVNKLVSQYRKASDAQFALSVLFCDNYDELVIDLAQAGTEFAAGIAEEYSASMNMAMIARSLFEAQYSVEEASLFLYAVQKALALTGASSALASAGFILPNKNGAGAPKPLHPPTPCHNRPAISEAGRSSTPKTAL